MKIGLILAAAAAGFAYYKYSKMSDEQRKNMVNNLKNKGKKLYDRYMPEKMKEMFPEQA